MGVPEDIIAYPSEQKLKILLKITSWRDDGGTENKTSRSDADPEVD